MATLSELVETIADAEGMDASTVALIARYIREAGLITTGGRGPSAARMSVSDATNLLIGVNATTNASEAANVVRRYRDLESYQVRSLADSRPVQKYGMLGEAIGQLIEATGAGEIREQFFGQDVPFDLQEAFSLGNIRIDLKFRTSHLFASLRILALLDPDVMTPAMVDEWPIGDAGGKLLFAFSAPKPRGPPTKKKIIAGDRFVETTIGYPTLRAIGKLLQPSR
jgi:hypothetical protein